MKGCGRIWGVSGAFEGPCAGPWDHGSCGPEGVELRNLQVKRSGFSEIRGWDSGSRRCFQAQRTSQVLGSVNPKP